MPALSHLKIALVKSGTTVPMQRSKAMPISAFADLFHSWPDNGDLDISRLRMKCLTLLAYVCMLRPSDVAPGAELYNPEDSARSVFEFTTDDVSLTGGHMDISFHGIKNDYQRKGMKVSVKPASDPTMCPVGAMSAYLDKTRQCRSDTNKHVFIALKPPYQGLTVGSIARILNEAIKLAGLTGYTAKDFRSSGATAAVQAGLPEETIMKVGRWRSADVFREHYIHSKVPDDYTDKIVSSV